MNTERIIYSMKKRELTCIVCPMGCKINITFNDENEIENICGNTCKRGEEYAKNECTHPVRMVTTTALCENGEVVPVKTNIPIPKEKIFECMREINKLKVVLPISVGDVIIENVVGTDANIIVCCNKNK